MKYVIYRANKSNTGAATSIEFNTDKKMLFLVSAKQIGTDEKGNANFGWSDPKTAITVKMGLPDIGEFLTILNGVKPKIAEGKGLFHENPKGNTIVNLETYTKDNRTAYSFKVSSKRDGVTTQIQHMISLGEGQVIKVILQEAILAMVYSASEKKKKLVPAD